MKNFTEEKLGFTIEHYNGFRMIGSQAGDNNSKYLVTVNAPDCDACTMVHVIVVQTKEQAFAQARAFVDLDPDLYFYMHHIGEDVCELREGKLDERGNPIVSHKLPERKLYFQSQQAEIAKVIKKDEHMRALRKKAQRLLTDYEALLSATPQSE